MTEEAQSCYEVNPLLKFLFYVNETLLRKLSFIAYAADKL